MTQTMDSPDLSQFELHELRYSGNVCISGLTAAGKTTHSHLLAGELGLTYVSGSQIQLNFMGLSPIQSKDFWITSEAKRFWNEKEFNRIDAELLRLETLTEGYMFDTSTMPWRHKKPALCIWLESDLKSRVIKSIVSHRGRGQFSTGGYPEMIAEKDSLTISLYKRLYGIDIGTDLSCFQLILNLSSLISKPSLEESLNSISVAHNIIRPAVAWYLTRKPSFLGEFNKAVNQHSDLVIRNALTS